MRHRSLLDELLLLMDAHACAPWFRANAAAFVRVCDLFARTACQHHDQLVARFIEQPANRLDAKHLPSVTASGPPLPVLLRALETLRDYRTAAPRDDLATRAADLTRLRKALGTALS
jgi:hypothetical protein